MSEYNYKTIKKLTGKALHHYNMISDGEKIAVGLSGGKDSMTLLWILNERLSRIPIKYELYPIYIDPGFEGGFSEQINEYCTREGHNLIVDHTDNGLIAHSPENRENPCFLCSRLRRKRMFEIADSLGCKKMALGHNKDDIIETLFLNMCYAGEISTMSPLQTFFQGKFMIIRPLAFLEESTIIRFVKDKGLPVFENPCPSANVSKRAEIKEMLGKLYRSNRKIKGNIFRAMRHVKLDYML